MTQPCSRCWLFSFFLIGGLALVSDLWTKNIIAGTLPAAERTRDQLQQQVVIPHWFSLLYNHALNQGALFSLGNNYGHLSNYILTGLCAAASVGILVWLFWPHLKRTPLQVVTLAFIWGGATGNFHDRLLYGGVRDWIWVYFERGPNDYPFNWPVFNLADCFLVGGVILLFLDNLFFHRSTKASEAAS